MKTRRARRREPIARFLGSSPPPQKLIPFHRRLHLEPLEHRHLLSGSPPVAVDDVYTTNEDRPLVIDTAAAGVLANDTDPENEPLTAHLGSPLTGGQSWDASSGVPPWDASVPTEARFSVEGDASFLSMQNGFLHFRDTTDPVQVQVRKTDVPSIQAGDSWAYEIELQMHSHERANLDWGAELGIVDQSRWGMIIVATDRVGFQGFTGDSFVNDEWFPVDATDDFHVFRVVKDSGSVSLFVDTFDTPALTVPYADLEPSSSSRVYLADTSTSGTSEFDVRRFAYNLNVTVLPEHGSLTLNPDGTFEYTPDADFYGTDRFTYIANDGTGSSNEATVTITVDPVWEGVISGTVFEDLNLDGVFDPEEGGLQGWTVEVQQITGGTDLLHTFVNPAPATNDRFGRSVAVVGDRILIGADQDDVGATDAGAAYLYDGTTFELLHRFENPDPGHNDRFGNKVAALGDDLLISAYLDDVGASEAGAVYLFDAHTYELLHTFQNPEPATGDRFGEAIATDGERLVIGAPNYETSSAPGKAYVFDVNTRQLLYGLNNPEPQAGDSFGGTATIAEGKILIGARWDNHGAVDSGSAYLFDAGTGSLLHTFRNPTPAQQDFFGSGVLVTADYITIGAEQDDEAGTNAGAVYLFDPATFELQRTFFSPTPTADDFLGRGNGVAVGDYTALFVPGDDTAGVDAGAVFLIDPSTGEVVHTITNPSPSPNDVFGYPIVLFGDDVLVAAQQEEIGATDAGAVYLFQGPPQPVTTTTDADGNYSFSGLEPGEYTVRLVVPDGATQTAPPDGFYTVALGEDEVVDDRHFGAVEPPPLFQIVWGEDAAGNPNQVAAVGGAPFSVTVRYTTSDENPALTGLGLRMHFNSDAIALDGLSNVLSGLVGQPQVMADTSDYDGDPATDAFVLVSWYDVGGDWPGGTLPADLFAANFTAALSPDGTTTPVNFTRVSTPSGYGLDATPVAVTIQSGSLDVDDNGEADALTDGIIVLRYLFGFDGSALVEGALAENAKRTTPADIGEFLDNCRTTMLDVDASGEADALTDGILILRYLFGFTDGPLIDAALATDATRTLAGEIVAFLDHFNPGVQGTAPLAPLAAVETAPTADQTEQAVATAAAYEPPAARPAASTLFSQPRLPDAASGRYDRRAVSVDRVMASGADLAQLRDPVVDDAPTAAFRRVKGWRSAVDAAIDEAFAGLGV